MPTVIVGDNSYISVADADAYYDSNLRFEAWNALDLDTKERGLITASTQISLAVNEDCKLPLTPPIPDSLAFATRFRPRLERFSALGKVPAFL